MVLETLVFLAVGLVGLWIGADFLIRGSKNLAAHLGLSYLFVGLAIVSIGTSIPELAVSVTGGMDRLAGIETSGIVVGNTVGSALSQISLLLGLLAFVLPLKLKPAAARRLGGFLIAAVLLLFGLAFDGLLSQTDGLIAIGGFLLYYIFLLFSIRKEEKTQRRVRANLPLDLTYVLIGLAVVAFTSQIVVDSGITLALELGVAQSMVGILLIGLGTGLPELSVAIASLRRKAVAISVGNLIGSNIVDLLLALGAGTVISGFAVNSVILSFDIPALLFLTFLVTHFLRSGRRISRTQSAALVTFFVIYVALKIFVTG